MKKYELFDRNRIKFKSLSFRKNKVSIEDIIDKRSYNIKNITNSQKKIIENIAYKIERARDRDKPVVMVFGAHSIKNGLAKIFIDLLDGGWVTHLATNGAGIIHDWELAYQGKTSEDVRANVAEGEFGIWQETGFFINLALAVGAYEGLGYGESIGKMIENDCLDIPQREELKYTIENYRINMNRASAAIDLLEIIDKFKIPSGKLEIPHPYKEYSVQRKAYSLGIPFTGHPMIGHDIIYTHPINRGSIIGRTAEMDFLKYAYQISRIDGGVYLSIGSAVMSPMVFEKSFSMAQNIAIQKGYRIKNHYICVVDLVENNWDWSKGIEPPQDDPAYYLRYCKSFSRMGGEMDYIAADNRDFLVYLLRTLECK